MKIELKADGIWYHGSPLLLSELREGSTITQWKELAEAFSHKPTQLEYNEEGHIRHDGKKQGYLFMIEESVQIGKDICPHPGTTMDKNAEFLTKRPLKIKMIAKTIV